MEEQGLGNMRLQQDGATAHTAPWPAISPDLTAPDVFLRGFLKSKVYVNKFQAIQHLKDNIRHEIDEIQPQMLQDVRKIALERVESCMANRDHRLADIMFQS
ncbi:hypothetical protein GWI33_011729 [Rhynchophorus ferrugineus]|uniref:Uncharacterized protein n=1 Tax=Rhynchophorus ferrugineus TaxID=354439 RepID=A0A834J1J5_RHYFE|nr:hypothetical protein GWI33_011729 [Rhynchophorus ferrugineus]